MPAVACHQTGGPFSSIHCLKPHNWVPTRSNCCLTHPTKSHQA